MLLWVVGRFSSDLYSVAEGYVPLNILSTRLLNEGDVEVNFYYPKSNS